MSYDLCHELAFLFLGMLIVVSFILVKKPTNVAIVFLGAVALFTILHVL